MSYDNYSNYNDGGFSNDGNYTDNTGGDNGSDRPQQTRSILSPVTIKQINDATQPVPDGDFCSGKVILNMVSFVGVVRKVEDQTSAVLLTVEDGTGSIDIKRWVDDKLTTAGEETELYSAMVNKYVYVTGALKEFSKKKAVQHSYIHEITDHNELIYHMLYTVSNYLSSEGLLGVSVAKPETSSGLFVGNTSDSSGGAALSNQDRIMALITANSTAMAEGVHVKWISNTLDIPEKDVEETCLALSEQARIYQGYDAGSYLSI